MSSKWPVMAGDQVRRVSVTAWKIDAPRSEGAVQLAPSIQSAL